MWRLSKNGRIDELIVFKFRDNAYVPAGQLSFEGGRTQRIGRFTYAASYLASDGADIDPVGLPRRRRSQPAQPEEVQLAFHDSGPDGWGKAVLNNAFPTLSLGMPEYLALGNLRRTGDLAYGPTPAGPATWHPTETPLVGLPDADDNVEALLAAAHAFEHGERSDPGHLALLVRTSSGLGGARPKARLRHRDGDWIAKFSAQGDTFDNPKLEAACLDVAAAAGIETPRHEILDVRGRAVLLVERFDRDASGRPLGYLSAGTLLNESSFSYSTKKSYVDIIDIARKVGAPDPAGDVFARFLVNAHLHNTDDHLRNHAFINRGGGWFLSPVFDVVPNLGRHGHVLAPAPGLSPQRDVAAARAVFARFGLKKAEADAIITRVEDAVRAFPKFLDSREVRRTDREQILGAIGMTRRLD